MLGAIIGDIVGSRFEFDNIKTKEFELFTDKCEFTDDTVMTLAVADAILSTDKNLMSVGFDAEKKMRQFGKEYPGRGYGGRFKKWLESDDPKPYRSWGNGSAMRVSACGFAAVSETEAKTLSEEVTNVTHNNEEALKGAEATAVVIYWAKKGKSKDEIRKMINERYYNLDFTLDKIRPVYMFTERCRDTVPQALEAFLESENFEDAIRNAISIGGDSDTIGAITGAVAEAFYGVPYDIRKKAESYLDERLLKIVNNFEYVYNRTMCDEVIALYGFLDRKHVKFMADRFFGGDEEELKRADRYVFRELASEIKKLALTEKLALDFVKLMIRIFDMQSKGKLVSTEDFLNEIVKKRKKDNQMEKFAGCYGPYSNTKFYPKDKLPSYFEAIFYLVGKLGRESDWEPYYYVKNAGLNFKYKGKSFYVGELGTGSPSGEAFEHVEGLLENVLYDLGCYEMFYEGMID